MQRYENKFESTESLIAGNKTKKYFAEIKIYFSQVKKEKNET